MAAFKTKKWKWVLGVFVFLFLAGIAGWYYLKRDLAKPNSAVERSISEQFAEMITEASDSLYKVSYSRFDLNLDSGKGIINNFRLVPDTLVLERLIRSNRAPNNLLTMQVENLVLSDFGFKKTDQGRRFTINRVIIQHPSMTVVNALRPYNISAKDEKHGKLFSFLQTMLKISSIHSLSMRDMDFTYVNANSEVRRTTRLKNLNIDMGGISALETGAQGKKSTEIVVSRYRLATPDSLYYLTANNFRFVPDLKTVRISGAALTPRLSKKAFYQRVKWAKDRIHLKYTNIQMTNIDVDRLIKTQQVHIETYAVDYSFAEVYTNYNWPRRTPPVRKNPYPHQQLQQIAFDLTIDSMRLKNSDTFYRVLADKSDQVSSLDINDSRGLILNITNNKAAIQRNPYSTASFKGKLMGEGPLQLDMKFNLADPKGRYSYTSTLGLINAKYFNRFSEPFSMMSVKEGRINKMYMTVKADEFKASGKVNLYYTGMKVALLKKDDDTKELKDRKVISALSNLFLPNDNPTKGGKFKDGPINVLRPSNMSFFGFMSKCMVDGMSSSMTGLEQQKKRPESNIVTEIGEAIIGAPGKKGDKKK
jgi:hypothetical protein